MAIELMCRAWLQASNRDSANYQALPEVLLGPCNQITEFCRLYIHLFSRTPQVFSKSSNLYDLWKQMCQPYQVGRGQTDPWGAVRTWIAALRQSGFFSEIDEDLAQKAPTELLGGDQFNQIVAEDWTDEIVVTICEKLGDWARDFRKKVIREVRELLMRYFEQVSKPFIGDDGGMDCGDASPQFSWPKFRVVLEGWAANADYGQIAVDARTLVEKMDKTLEDGAASRSAKQLIVLAATETFDHQ